MKTNGFVIFLMLLLCSNVCFADSDPASGAFYTIMTESKTLLNSYSGKLNGIAMWLFDSLCMISLVLTLGRSFVEKGTDFGWDDLFWPLIRLILLMGFVYFLLFDVDKYLGALISEFAHYAQTIVPSVSSVRNPSQLVFVGWDVALRMWASVPDLELTSIHSWINIIIIFIVIVFMMCFFVSLAFDMLLVYLSFMLVCYGGIFFLGFMGYEQTRALGFGYLKALLSNAVTYYAMLCMAGLTINVLTSICSGFDAQASVESFAPATVMVLSAYVMRKLIVQVPMMIGACISQSNIGLNQGNGIFAGVVSSGLKGMALGTGAVAFTTAFSRARVGKMLPSKLQMKNYMSSFIKRFK